MKLGQGAVHLLSFRAMRAISKIEGRDSPVRDFFMTDEQRDRRAVTINYFSKQSKWRWNTQLAFPAKPVHHCAIAKQHRTEFVEITSAFC